MFDAVRKLLTAKGGQSAEALRSALGSIDIDALNSSFAAAEADRREALLTGTDAEVSASEQKVDRARIALDRGRAAVEELKRRIATAEAAEADAEWARERADVENKATRAAKRLLDVYPRASAEIIEVLTEVNAAQAAVSAFNNKLLANGRTQDGYVADVENRAWSETDHRYLEQYHATRLTQLRPTPTSSGYGQAAYVFNNC